MNKRFPSVIVPKADISWNCSFNENADAVPKLGDGRRRSYRVADGDVGRRVLLAHHVVGHHNTRLLLLLLQFEEQKKRKPPFSDTDQQQNTAA